MNYKKERKFRMRERRALERIRELSGALTEVTNSYERLVVVDRAHISGLAFHQTIQVLSSTLLDAVQVLGRMDKPTAEPPRETG